MVATVSLLIIGLALVAVDLVITSDDHLSWIGFGFLGLAALSLGGASLVTLAAAFPVVIFGSVFFVRKWIRARPRPKSDHWFREVSGKIGGIIVVEDDDACFGRIQIAHQGEWRCRSSNSQRLIVKGRAQVVGHDGLVLLVSMDGPPNGESTGAV